MTEPRATSTGWLDPVEVARALGRPELADDEELVAATEAAGYWIKTVRRDLADELDGFTPTPDVNRAGVILALDLYRRPATYGGAGAILTDLGSLGMVPGVDPMVERLLGIGRFRRGGRIG